MRDRHAQCKETVEHFKRLLRVAVNERNAAIRQLIEHLDKAEKRLKELETELQEVRAEKDADDYYWNVEQYELDNID